MLPLSRGEPSVSRPPGVPLLLTIPGPADSAHRLALTCAWSWTTVSEHTCSVLQGTDLSASWEPDSASCQPCPYRSQFSWAGGQLACDTRSWDRRSQHPAASDPPEQSKERSKENDGAFSLRKRNRGTEEPTPSMIDPGIRGQETEPCAAFPQQIFISFHPGSTAVGEVKPPQSCKWTYWSGNFLSNKTLEILCNLKIFTNIL